MKIIFDNEEQLNTFFNTLMCPEDFFEGAPRYLCDSGCPGPTDENCKKCWEKYVEMEVKNG